MKIKFSFLVLFLCTLFYTLSAQKVDTIRILSPSMKKEIKNVIILPQDYEKNKKQSYPVVYLLHGHGGRYDSWIKETQPRLPELATEWGMIFVCPDGSNSWYWDSPVDSSSRYETYISQELTDYIDKNYRSIASPKGRAITGYSMGGHGALWLAFRHPDLYGAAGSMSGGVDIRPFPHSWHMKDYLGSYEKNPEYPISPIHSAVYRPRAMLRRGRRPYRTAPRCPAARHRTTAMRAGSPPRPRSAPPCCAGV